ncbi:MAG TPA: hypothetical protein VM534_08000 [Thermoanaerobaculia bacterium]|nr:hypothetical protein [Thermoanaerobaculia bacterium]
MTHELFQNGPREARRKVRLARDIVEHHTRAWRQPLAEIERLCRENPLLSMIAAIAIGMAIGRIVRRAGG